MNIKTQICGLVILSVIWIFDLHKRKLKLNIEKKFVQLLCCVTACCFLDVLSMVAIVTMSPHDGLIPRLISRGYLLSLIMVVLLALRYVCVDIVVYAFGKIKMETLFEILSVIYAVVIFLVPIKIHFDESTQVLYIYGPAAVITYIIDLVTLFGIVLVQFIKKEYINQRRRRAIWIWMLIWIVAAAIQIVFPDFLIVGFATTIGTLVLYLQFENPELRLDANTGMFNQPALLMYVNQLLREMQPFSMVVVQLDTPYGKVALENCEKKLFKLSEPLSKISKVKPFRISEEQVCLVCEGERGAIEMLPKIQRLFADYLFDEREGMLRVNYTYIVDTKLVHSAKHLLELVYSIQAGRTNQLQQNVFGIDKKAMLEMFQQKELEKVLFDAVREDRLEVYYQPIYSFEKKRFSSMEALVRIFDAEGKMISPADFIPIAEQNGMILTIGEMVFEKVCKFFREARLKEKGIDYVEVNLSVIQCAQKNLARRYIRIMEKYKLRPEMINLEITETASVEAKKILLDNMDKLIRYGVYFSLDDFGTGQSNLNYIAEMPVKIVKFDRYMTNSYFTNDKAKYVMEAAIQMIHGMNMKIVAEGIETEENLQAMQELGIDYIQGFYFSKPVPEKEFLKFIKERNV